MLTNGTRGKHTGEAMKTPKTYLQFFFLKYFLEKREENRKHNA